MVEPEDECKGEVEESEEEGDMFGEGVRSLFEMSFPTQIRTVSLQGSSLESQQDRCGERNSQGQINIQVVCSDFDYPGALQSGKFLWPASKALSQYLFSPVFFNLWSEMNLSACKEFNILELGAGAGLVGLACSSLFYSANSQRTIVCTDRDPFLLDMILESAQLLPPTSSVEIRTAELSWGTCSAEELEGIRNEVLVDRKNKEFQLIVGADLTYSTEAILDLFVTVHHAMPKDGHFILCSSFRADESSDIIQAFCKEHGMKRTVLCNSLKSTPQACTAYEAVLIEHFSRA